jgi:hypothetical protein
MCSDNQVQKIDEALEPTIYIIIAENTNLYAIVWEVAIAPTLTNSQY